MLPKKDFEYLKRVFSKNELKINFKLIGSLLYLEVLKKKVLGLIVKKYWITKEIISYTT